MTDNASKFLRLSEIARQLDISLATVQRLVVKGKLAAYKFGGQYRVRLEDWQRFLESSRTTPASTEAPPRRGNRQPSRASVERAAATAKALGC